MKIVNLKIDQIKPYEKNPRNNAEAVPHVARSIHEFGFQQPLVLDENHVIIVGHTRLLAAKSLGLSEVPCVVTHMEPEKAKAYRLMDNRTHERATWNDALLMAEIAELEGFYTPDFLDFSEKVEPEPPPPKEDDPYTKKIELPTYEPKGAKPKITHLFDDQKAKDLIKEINASDIDPKLKNFLKLAAYRHIVFKYSDIAEYYCHSEKQVQDLMEKSALVIVDFNKAIECGFVRVTEKLVNAFDLSTEEET